MPAANPGPETTAGQPGSTPVSPGTSVRGSAAGINKPADSPGRPDSAMTAGHDSSMMEREEVLDNTYSIPAGETVRVFLAAGATYRAEINNAEIRLQLRPIDQSIQAPLVEEFLAGTGAGGSTTLTIRPRQDGEYEIRSIGGDPTAVVNVHLIRQPSNQ
ncbi:MAG: hypothetical protein ABI613_10255, partial [Gemmatimonadota bacterium]